MGGGGGVVSVGPLEELETLSVIHAFIYQIFTERYVLECLLCPRLC